MSDTTQRPRRATIEDVAADAGVSVATVSRALRGLPNVAVSTRERVNRVAAALDYQPNPAASRLAAGRSRTVTVAVPTLNGWYFSTVVAGAEAVCAEEGYDFLVVGVGSQTDRSHLVAESAQIERRTDGLILVDLALQPDEAASLRARGLPVTTIGNRAVGHPGVVVDDAALARRATEFLLELGHRTIGVIGGQPHDPMSFDVPKARRRGFLDAMSHAGVSAREEYFVSGNFGIDGGQEAMRALLDLDEPPSAVFAMSDEMAFGVIMEMRERGLEPGSDISVIGVDDHEFSRVIGLTTMRQSVSAHGAVAARLLIAQMASSDAVHGAMSDAMSDAVFDSAGIHQAPFELLVRATTGPCPG